MLVVQHGDHLRGNDLFAEGFEADGEVLQAPLTALLGVGLADMLQDAALCVRLPEELQQGHLSGLGFRV